MISGLIISFLTSWAQFFKLEPAASRTFSTTSPIVGDGEPPVGPAWRVTAPSVLPLERCGQPQAMA